ncbi:hypothetical protein HYFRA_00010400 [Hymenoscyphus fraxineus]|uniref:Clr5 domain-containing protein n=1 Tax=Hymenoscyphus fraxineus TaxID=746836 RepID=A0A9N9L1T2_9HELO|nr:hypothetical protein HYFRA_00010400 [Hymenoscyphus fraxineus]
MKDDFRFDALEHQYKYQLKKWGMTKNMPSKKKESAILAIRKRTKDPNSSMSIKYNGETIDKRKIRRHISDVEKGKKEQEDTLQLNINAFIQWNLPYRAFRYSSVTANSPFSPFGSTPSDISIGSPFGTNPVNAPSPTMLAIRVKTLNERARLFITGAHDDLMKNMDRREKKILTTWLYQFWLFSFETAKHWGHGPQEWTAELLDFERYKDTHISSTTDTPMPDIGTPYPATPGALLSSDHHESLPSKLCKWTIHAFISFRYRRECVAWSEAEEIISIGGENWPRWTESSLSQNLDEKLQQALETNSFSNIRVQELPLAITQIARITKRSKIQIVLEAFSFSIIARNEEVFWKLLDRVTSVDFAVLGLYPHHLATTYLDGSNTCCNLLDATVNNIRFSAQLYINDYGHTVLDNLFITILKGHTCCPPVTVDDTFRKLRRFLGKEVDIYRR